MNRSLRVAYGNFIFRHRNQVFPGVLLLLMAGLRPQLPFDDARWDAWVDLCGIALACAGQGLRVLVIGLAYIRRGGLDKSVYAERFVTEGVFGHCRNPLYVGNLMILAGLFAVHGNLLAAVGGLSFFFFSYGAMVCAEERYLHEKFGSDYEDYCAKVNRWLPDWSGLRQTLSSAGFNWRRVIAKDYASCCAWILLALMLLGFETVLFRLSSFDMPGAVLHNPSLLFAMFVGVLLLGLAAWTVKHRVWRGRPEIA